MSSAQPTPARPNRAPQTTAPARPPTSRRAFLRRSAVAAAAVAALRAERLLAAPYDPLASKGPGPGHGLRRPIRPMRVRGVVRADGRGVPRVAVSDGLRVVDTGPDGSFELVTDSDRAFVWMSVPPGYEVPVSPSGAARFYEPIPAAGDDHAVSFDLSPLATPDERHALLLLGDIQTETEAEMARFHDESVPDLRRTVEELGDIPTVGIADGDIMFDRLELYPEYERGVRRIGVPFFQVVGNHDLDMSSATDEGSTDTFSRHFGPRHYSFNRGAVHYVVLDDVFWHGSGYLGYLDADALAWLRADLSRVEPGSPVIAATHIPALGSYHARRGLAAPEPTVAITNRDALYRLLEPFQAHILTGHTHEVEHVFEGGAHEHVTGAICGAWWSGPICHDGAPNGYCVYEASGEEIMWRYKATGFPAAHQMRLYAPGADPAAPEEMVANIWNWDPAWTVRWAEDGQPRGLMARRRGRDPLSAELHSGDDLPAHRPWVEPRVTDHLFYARPAPGAREVRVEATDRFGRAYVESLTLAG